MLIKEMNKTDKNLESLLETKRMIEAEIRKLKKSEMYAGCIKIHKEHFPTKRLDEWKLSIMPRIEVNENYQRRTMYRSIFTTLNKNEIGDYITEVIKDLEKMKEQLEEENE